jgi:hypothetical protein
MDAIRVNKNTRVNQVSSRTQLVRSDSNLIDFFIGDTVKRILLTQGQFALVDDDMYEWLNQWKWYVSWNKNTQSFYAFRAIRIGKVRTSQSMARQILGLKKDDKRQADHIDHNTLDNRITNLRIVTIQQNSFNRNPAGYSWHKASKKYRARIKLNDKEIHLGYFRTAIEARNIYLRAKKIYHKF